jgi:hypothetical protein
MSPGERAQANAGNIQSDGLDLPVQSVEELAEMGRQFAGGYGAGGSAIDPRVGPTPEMLYDYAQQTSGLQQQYEMELAQADAMRRMASMDTQGQLRGLGAQQAGQRADVMSAMGEAGMGLSPAIQAAAIDDPASQFARARSGVLSGWAQTQEQLMRNRQQAERGYYGGLDRADAQLQMALGRMAQERQRNIYDASGRLIG